MMFDYDRVYDGAMPFPENDPQNDPPKEPGPSDDGWGNGPPQPRAGEPFPPDVQARVQADAAAALAEVVGQLEPDDPRRLLIENPGAILAGWDVVPHPHGVPAVPLTDDEVQAVLLALALLSLHRPGWHGYLAGIAGRWRGRPLFEEFRRLNADRYGPETHP